MAIDVTTLALAKAYAKGLLESWSGSTGKNVTIESIVAIDGGNRITFGFTDDNGVAQEKALDVMDGKDGADGKNGTNGTNGKDGTSPVISVSTITGGHRITITDANGTKTVDVMDGSDGKNGNDGASGDDGVTPQFSIGTVETLEAGSAATASIVGTAEKPVLNLGIPKGKDGSSDSGGNVENGEDGFSPIATVTQTDTGAVISITDKDGTTTATITNGKDGKDGADGAPGEKGDKGDPGEPGQKGEQGIQGIPGEKGDKGDKGDTGAPGADGAKGDKGDKGDTGATGSQGEPGKDGANGKDGTSATHSWNGTVLTITTASGTSSADLKGAKGDKGDKGDTGATGSAGSPGKDGKTPVKGTDYFTEADKQEIAEQAAGLVEIPDGGGFVASDTAPTDTSILWVDTSDDSNDGFQEAVNMALAQAKASGEFNGSDGRDGQDGYTPVKGVDYFDGANGTNGKTPVKGTDYFTAADKAEMVNAVLAALPVYAGEVV